MLSVGQSSKLSLSPTMCLLGRTGERSAEATEIHSPAAGNS